MLRKETHNRKFSKCFCAHASLLVTNKLWTVFQLWLLPDLIMNTFKKRCNNEWCILSLMCSQVLEGRPIFVDCYGNLAPLTKAGQQLILNFYAFKENRLPFCVKVLHSTPLPTTPRSQAWMWSWEIYKSTKKCHRKLLKLQQSCHYRVQKGTRHNAGEKQQPGHKTLWLFLALFPFRCPTSHTSSQYGR